MDIQATKIELIKQLLEVKKESVLNKVKEILSSEEISVEEEIVAYTSHGKPLTKSDYSDHIHSIREEIEKGAQTFVAEEVQEYVLNKNKR